MTGRERERERERESEDRDICGGFLDLHRM
jgi:hypothetical protein